MIGALVFVLVLFGLWRLAPVLVGPAVAAARHISNQFSGQLGIAAAAGLVLIAVRALILRAASPVRSGQVDWQHVLPVIALAFASAGQGLLLLHRVPAGTLLYLVAGAMALVAAIVWRERPEQTENAAAAVLSSRAEVALASLVLAVSVFLRFYLVGHYPYGLEGDESKWTWSVYYEMLAKDPIWPSGLFYKLGPSSFWIESLFFRALGPTAMTARLMVAVLSTVSGIVFYLFVRRIAGPPVALIAFFLLSVSFVDVSASRLGSPESQVKLWIILAPCFALWAVERKRWPLYLLCGLAVGGGLLSHHTFHAMAAVVGLYLLAPFLRSRSGWGAALVGCMVFGLAVLPFVPATLQQLDLHQGDYTRVWQDQGVALGAAGQGILGNPRLAVQRVAQFLPFLRRNLFDLVGSLFVHQRWGDFLMNREGAIENVALLPFLVAGLAWAARQVRHRHYCLILLWFALVFFPVALIVGAVYVRVLYPAYPAIYVLIALGLWWTRSALGRLWRGRQERFIITSTLMAFLALVGLSNTYIYFREVRDFDDRMHRRALGDEILAAISPGSMVFGAYLPKRGDPVEIEWPLLRFVVEGRMGRGTVDGFYRMVPFNELLARVSQERPQYQELRILSENVDAQAPARQERLDALHAVERCFPGSVIESGKYVTSLAIPPAALSHPVCTADAHVQLAQPAGAVLPAGQPPQFAWKIDRGTPSQVRLQVERRNDLVLPVEAEDFAKEQGWGAENRYVDGFSGSGFLADQFRAGKTSYQLPVPAAGGYDVWVRSYRRVADDTHVFLDAGGGPVEFAQADPARLNQWVWQLVGHYDFAAGQVQLSITKSYGTAPHMSIFIDQLFVSRDATFDPRTSSLWERQVDQLLPAAPDGSYTWENAVSQPGEYRWRLELVDGDRLVDSAGRPGIWSEYQTYRVAEAGAT